MKNRNVIILVDSNSTHNYIDINLAKKVNSFVYPTKDPTIGVINGHKVKGIGRCHKIYVQIKKLELQIGFYNLPLDMMDMVLYIE
jgi:hypothetical protein